MDQKASEKLFLVDALYLLFRAFHAPTEMGFSSRAGIPTQGTYIFVRTLRKLLRQYDPHRVAVAFDLAAPTYRDKLFRQYKANRPPFPEELNVQIPYVRRFCRALGIPLVEKEGFEADDAIGTLAKQGSQEGLNVLIVSGDEDLCQLVDERTFLLKPARSAADTDTLIVQKTPEQAVEEHEKSSGREWSEGERRKSREEEEAKLQALLGGVRLSKIDVKSVRDILGVDPAQVVDWLALTGDPSDNIPGARPFPGQEVPLAEGQKKRSYIGPKGATELIRRFGRLEKVLESWTSVERPSYRDALREFSKEALLSQELARIRTDVPLHVTLDELKPGAMDTEAIRALCLELGFASLLGELLEAAPGAEALAESEEIISLNAFEQWLEAIPASAKLAVAFAFEGEEGWGGRLSGLGLFDGQRAAVVRLSGSPKLLSGAASILADSGRPKAVHNSKLLRLLLAKEQIALEGASDDTMLYSYLLDPLASSHGLAEMGLRRLGRKLSHALGEAARLTGELAALLAPEISSQGLKKLYDEIELPLSAVLADLEAAGVRIDAKILARMSQEFAKELEALTREIYGLAGGAFDIDSPKQLGEVLFEKLKLPGGKRLKKSGQYSTAAAVLESLAETHELPQKILEYRTRAKLMSTYLEALPEYIRPETGRVHTSFNQTVARTGRLSSSNPNLQNIPIGDEFGLRIRSAFVAEPGWRLISADYSQIELRVLAHMSEDPRLVEAFTSNEDIHARTAQEIFGVLPPLQTHEHRRMAKAINYGVIYGLSSFGLAGRTGTSKTEAQQYIDAYFERYGKVKEFLDSLVREARQTGRVRTLFGRLRPIPEISSPDVPARNRAEREAMNTPLQGTAADLMKLAMVKLHARLRREKMQARMILTVHDELVVEAPQAELDAAREIVKAEMEGVYPLRVPLRVDIGMGENWKEAK